MIELQYLKRFLACCSQTGGDCNFLVPFWSTALGRQLCSYFWLHFWNLAVFCAPSLHRFWYVLYEFFVPKISGKFDQGRKMFQALASIAAWLALTVVLLILFYYSDIDVENASMLTCISLVGDQADETCKNRSISFKITDSNF